MIFNLSLHLQCASINYKNIKKVNKSRYPRKKLPSNREVTFSIVIIFEILFTYITSTPVMVYNRSIQKSNPVYHSGLLFLPITPAQEAQFVALMQQLQTAITSFPYTNCIYFILCVSPSNVPKIRLFFTYFST